MCIIIAMADIASYPMDCSVYSIIVTKATITKAIKKTPNMQEAKDKHTDERIACVYVTRSEKSDQLYRKEIIRK